MIKTQNHIKPGRPRNHRMVFLLFLSYLLFHISYLDSVAGTAHFSESISRIEPIDLSNASIIADRAHRMRHVPLPGLIPDKNGETFNSITQDLADQPANLIVLIHDEIQAVAIEVTTIRDDEDLLRLNEFEVYAWNSEKWEFLGDTNGRVRTREVDSRVGLLVDLLPVRTQMLRVRLLGTERESDTYAQVREIRLFSSIDDVPEWDVSNRLQTDHKGNNDLRSEATAPVRDSGSLDSGSFPQEAFEMRLLTQWLLDRGIDTGFRKYHDEPTPAGSFDPDKGYLGYVLSFMDTMLEFGTDRYGKTHSPIFMSILDVRTLEHPGYSLPTTGPRQHDRAHFGANLQFDIPLLEAMEFVSEITGDQRYRRAGRDYLQYWLNQCTDTATGLWPWGEHVYYDVYLGQPESSQYLNHEYNDDPPTAFWERAWEKNPEAVLRQAAGVRNHIIDFENFVFNRHAWIDRPLPVPRPPELIEQLRRHNLDFPRQSGYWIRLWAFLYDKTGNDTYISWIEEVLDHYDEVLIPHIGLLPVLSEKTYRPLPDRPSGSNVAIALDRARPYLEKSRIGDRFTGFTVPYTDSLHHLLPDSTPEVSFGKRKDGSNPVGYATEDALHWVHLYRRFGDERFYDQARTVAEVYAAIDAIPYDDYDHIRADLFATAIQLMLDMHELDGRGQWLSAAEKYAQWAIERLYYNGLFLGATNSWYYDANLRVSSFVYSLVRLHTVLKHDEEEEHVPPLYFRPSRAGF